MAEQIQYDDATHTYRDKFGVVPSVTQVIHNVLMTEEERRHYHGHEEAMLRGRHVHTACRLWSDGELDEDSLDPRLVPYVDGWKLFAQESAFVCCAWEQLVYSRRERYAGRYDVRGRIGERRTLADIKSGATAPWTVGVQLAGYARAGGLGAIDRLCVHLPGNGKYRAIECKQRTDERVFLAALTVHNARLQRGKT